MKSDEINLNNVKNRNFSTYLENSFTKKSKSFTLIPESILHSLFYLNKKKWSSKSNQNNNIYRNQGNQWVEDFIKELKDDKWKFDNSEFEEFKNKMNNEWREMKEIKKQIKAKVEYEEEILILKNQIIDLQNEILEKQKVIRENKKDFQEKIKDLTETNQILLEEIQILKENLQNQDQNIG